MKVHDKLERSLLTVSSYLIWFQIACEQGEGKERGREKEACRNVQGFRFPNAVIYLMFTHIYEDNIQGSVHRQGSKDIKD